MVDVVIGVETDVHTHSAAAIYATTCGVLDEITAEATVEGYAVPGGVADEHATLRAWAIGGTGGHGAGLSRHLADREEIVVELNRPKRAKHVNGAKFDPLDAIRAAREAATARDPALVGSAKRSRCCSPLPSMPLPSMPLPSMPLPPQPLRRLPLLPLRRLCG